MDDPTQPPHDSKRPEPDPADPGAPHTRASDRDAPPPDPADTDTPNHGTSEPGTGEPEPTSAEPPEPDGPDAGGPEELPPSAHFALVAAIFEGGLAVIAVGLGWFLGIDPMATLHYAGADLGWAMLATLPPLGLLWLCLICPWRPFRRLSQVVNDFMLPLLARCSLAELAVISTLAGLGEEMLFRGIVQAGIARWIGGPGGIWLGLAAAAVLFGLAHRITNLYALLAGLIGLYLGGLWLWTGNLLVPIVVHALYDFLALVYLVRMRESETASHHAPEHD